MDTVILWIHGDGRDGRLIITSNRPSSHYGI